jgi:hypothetical protein
MERLSLTAAALAVLCAATLSGQGRGGGQPSLTPKASAPFDITGYWVSLVTEDWRYRMLTPPKGDFAAVPLNAEGRRVAGLWDPAKDEASGELCRGYGAPALLRLPGRMHITWEDDQTLKVEADAGTQVRRFYFGNPQGEGGSWQGVSQAAWDFLPAPIVETGGGRASLSVPDRRGGSLRVVTTKLRPGYLRKNGVPYSANTLLTEYYDRVNEPDGDSHLVVTIRVEDPTYLAQPFLMSAHFKRQADASGWNPTPCSPK